MKVLCTHGLKSVMLALAAELERRSIKPLAMTWGATLDLVRDIQGGARADIAVLTAQAIDELAAQGKAVSGSRVDLARSAIGLAVRRGAHRPDISSPEALRSALRAVTSVARSKTGMSGVYFPSVLEQLGIAKEMEPKMVVPEPGILIGEIVARGDAEIGVQQISELLPVADIEILGPLPAPLQKITIFSAGVLASADDERAAAGLIDFIARASRPLLSAKGLEPP